MPTFIILGQWTPEGISKVKDTGQRIEKAKEVSRSFGGELKEVYYTFGRYDFVAISEAPSNEAAMKALLTIAGAGSVRTETLIATPANNFLDLVKDLP